MITLHEGKEQIFDYLTGVFTSNLQTISKYIDIESNHKAKEGANSMEGMGMSIYKKGIHQGMLQGKAEGILQGMAEGRKEEKYDIARCRAISGYRHSKKLSIRYKYKNAKHFDDLFVCNIRKPVHAKEIYITRCSHSLASVREKRMRHKINRHIPFDKLPLKGNLNRYVTDFWLEWL